MGNNNTTRFVGHEFRAKEFDQMIHGISSKADISEVLVRKFTERALAKWEKEANKDLLSLFTAKKSERQEEINRMCDYLRDYLRPIVISYKKIDQSIEIAVDSLEKMYHLF
ncbi:MAG: hypothetical protein ACTSWL_09115 [Promethearchaeota archaeon]